MKEDTNSNESSAISSSEIANDNVQNSQTQTQPETSYSAKNAELDELLTDATTTVEETKQQARDAKSDKGMTSEDAAGVAITGLQGVISLINSNTEHEIAIPEESLMLFAGLTAPLIIKYGAKINLDPNNVDLESWMPEMMAVGGAAVVGYPIYKQMTEKVVDNGDKSEHSA